MSLPESWSDAVLRRSPRACRVVAWFVAFLVTASFAMHVVRGSLAYLGLLEDDYFYYAIIADKLVSLGRLTYDGTTITNGFHPLWFVTLVLLRVVAGGLNAAFYLMLSAVFFASMVATYELSVRLARAVGASHALAPAVALVYAAATFLVVADGMETALDVPLLLWLLVEIAHPEHVTPRRAAKLGFVAALAVLARLDIAVAVALLGLGWLVLARPHARVATRAIGAFCVSGLAVPIYAAFNLAAFGSILPMSALAKQLVKIPGVQLSYLRSILQYTQYGWTAGPTLVLGTVALMLVWRRGRAGRHGLFASALALAFAAIFYATNALSGWTFFGWYAYPLAAALVVSLALVGQVLVERIPSGRRAPWGAAFVAGAMGLASVQGIWAFVTRGPLWSVADNGLLAMSVDLGERMRGRPGVYAMGAIGGFATYMVGQPMVQLEGLVTDRAMIDHIRREDDLGPVLREYRVDYLVITVFHVPMPKVDGCYEVTQPNVEWAGRRTKKMHQRICAEPILTFHTPGGVRPWSIFQGLDTYVFDVRAAADGSATR